MKLFLLLCLSCVASADIVVMTRNGPVKGTKTSDNPHVEAFLGIPYAEPPIDDLRFAKPLPKARWTDIYDATHLPPPCSQFFDTDQYFMPKLANMSEDCLYLNVWIPRPEEESKPVVIFIHGGVFYSGSSCMEIYDGSNFAGRTNIIVVTINYRLGALGFYATDSESAPGNMGMHDQILAIEWVKKNIEYFGGDPNEITLIGQSAGAHSIAAHMLSPLSKHMFQRGILLSGGVIHPMYFDNNERLFRNSQTLASLVGCANSTVKVSSDPGKVVSCLKKIPARNILEAEKNFIKSHPLTFFPRVNDDFLPRSTIELIRRGEFRSDVEILTGIAEDEGTRMLSLSFAEYFGHLGHDRVTLSKRTAKSLIEAALLAAKLSGIKTLSQYYVDSVNDSNPDSYIKALASSVGDYTITCSTIFQADFLSLIGNAVYYYKFNFRSDNSPFAEWMGASHLDDLPFVFGNPLFGNFTDEDLKFSKALMDRLSAFVKTGDPNIPGRLPWPRYHYNNPLYLNFGQNEESVRMGPADRCQIWRTFFQSDIDESIVGRFARRSNANTRGLPSTITSIAVIFLLLVLKEFQRLQTFV